MHGSIARNSLHRLGKAWVIGMRLRRGHRPSLCSPNRECKSAFDLRPALPTLNALIQITDGLVT
jgi:hypothetical protein